MRDPPTRGQAPSIKNTVLGPSSIAVVHFNTLRDKGITSDNKGHLTVSACTGEFNLCFAVK